MHSDLWNSISTNYCRYYEKQVECDNKLVSVKNKKKHILCYYFLIFLGGGGGNRDFAYGVKLARNGPARSAHIMSGSHTHTHRLHCVCGVYYFHAHVNGSERSYCSVHTVAVWSAFQVSDSASAVQHSFLLHVLN